MDAILFVVVAFLALALGGGLGYSAHRLARGRTLKSAQEEVQRILSQVEDEKKEILLAAKDEALRLRSSAEADLRERRTEQQRLERRIHQKEETLERRLDSLERREKNLANKEKDLDVQRTELEELKHRQQERLEAIAGMTAAEAKELLLKNSESEIQLELARRYRDAELRIKEEVDQKARVSLAVAIHRLAGDVVSESTVTVVPLPNDEMKGRIIGREGRNIRAIEAATGVDLIIDDTPEAVTISSFDPVRREVARVAVTKLVGDGRIHPARIEEVVEKSRQEVEETMRSEGEGALVAVGVTGFHPEIIRLLGSLKYRFSYGQNVLQHSIEVGRLAGMLATEIGANVEVAKKGGLLHDLGKALSHEAEGPHALIGGEVARKHGVPAPMVVCIEDHHEDSTAIRSVESFLVAAADAASGGRPGARRDTLEHYLKRLQALESVANSFPGVEKSFAIQAGREVRIMVKPDQVDDLAAAKLARDIVKKVEETLEFPGQIKVTVIRETRAIEYAR